MITVIICSENKISTGASNDLQKATQYVYQMVYAWGMTGVINYIRILITFSVVSVLILVIIVHILLLYHSIVNILLIRMMRLSIVY